jgi:hypothetical protein
VLTVCILPVGCEISPYSSPAPADCLAGNILRGDRPTLAKIRVGKRLRPHERNAGNGCTQLE